MQIDFLNSDVLLHLSRFLTEDDVVASLGLVFSFKVDWFRSRKETTIVFTDPVRGLGRTRYLCQRGLVTSCVHFERVIDLKLAVIGYDVPFGVSFATLNARRRRVDMLQFAYMHGLRKTADIVEIAVLNRDLSMLTDVVDRFALPHPSSSLSIDRICRLASVRPVDVHVADWLYIHRYRLAEPSLSPVNPLNLAAADHHLLGVMTLLRFGGRRRLCVSTMCVAARYGYINILTFLHQVGAPLSSKIINTAILHQRKKVLTYLLSVGCPYSMHSFRTCFKVDRLDMLSLLFTHNAIFDKDVELQKHLLLLAIKLKKYAFVHYLVPRVTSLSVADRL